MSENCKICKITVTEKTKRLLDYDIIVCFACYEDELNKARLEG